MSAEYIALNDSEFERTLDFLTDLAHHLKAKSDKLYNENREDWKNYEGSEINKLYYQIQESSDLVRKAREILLDSDK